MDKKIRQTINLGVDLNDKWRGNLVTWYKFAFADFV